MNNLKAEMARIGAKTADIGSILGCTQRTAWSKINGYSEFTVSEAIKVQKSLFPTCNFEYLFNNDNKAAS